MASFGDGDANVSVAVLRAECGDGGSDLGGPSGGNGLLRGAAGVVEENRRAGDEVVAHDGQEPVASARRVVGRTIADDQAERFRHFFERGGIPGIGTIVLEGMDHHAHRMDSVAEEDSSNAPRPFFVMLQGPNRLAGFSGDGAEDERREP